MYFGLSEDQEFFKDNVSKFLQDHAPLDVIKKIIEDDEHDLKNNIKNLKFFILKTSCFNGKTL